MKPEPHRAGAEWALKRVPAYITLLTEHFPTVKPGLMSGNNMSDLCILSFISHLQINLGWPDTCSRVSVGTSVRKDSSTLRGNAASPVLPTASCVWRQTGA